MPLPTQPVTLTAQQISDLNKKLSDMRHEINNYLALIIAAMELARLKPETAERHLGTLIEQPRKITGAMDKFSEEFERTFGITRPVVGTYKR